MLKQVLKKNGSLEPFNKAKIENAINKAFKAQGRDLPPPILYDRIMSDILYEAEAKSDEEVVDLEDIQDSIEKSLCTNGYFEVGKSFWIHRRAHNNITDIKTETLSYKDVVDDHLSPTYSICSDHGYIAGEQTVCPICGKKTERYSHIAEYCSPVKNWDDDKAQEFKEGVVYNISKFVPAVGESIQGETCNKEPENNIPIISSQKEKEYFLFTTVGCPNCKMAKILLDQSNIKYKVITVELFPEAVERLRITSAPTLIIDNGNERYTGVSNIKGYLRNKDGLK